MSKPSGNNFIKLKTSHHLICFHITRLNVKRYRIVMCSRLHRNVMYCPPLQGNSSKRIWSYYIIFFQLFW
jgi:hypothetical protein